MFLTRQEAVLCAFNALLALLSIIYLVRCSSGKRSAPKPDTGWDDYILISFLFTGLATIILIIASFVATICLTTPLIWRAIYSFAVLYLISYLIGRKEPNCILWQALTILAMLVCLNGFVLLLFAPHP